MYTRGKPLKITPPRLSEISTMPPLVVKTFPMFVCLTMAFPQASRPFEEDRRALVLSFHVYIAPSPESGLPLMLRYSCLRLFQK